MEESGRITAAMRELRVEEVSQVSGGAMSGGLEIQLSDFHPVAWPRILLPKVAKEIVATVAQQ